MKKENFAFHGTVDTTVVFLKLAIILLILIGNSIALIVSATISLLILLYEGKKYADKLAYVVFDEEYEDLLSNIREEVRGIRVENNDYSSTRIKIDNVLENYDIPMTFLETKVTSNQVIFYYGLGFTIVNNRKKFTKISQVENIKPEIELALGESIRLIPEKNKLGIAIINPEFKSLSFKEMVNEKNYKQIVKKYADGLPFCLGYDLNDNVVCGDATNFPHLLIAGETNSGKSNALQVFMTSMLMNKKVNELKLVLADFKLVELVAFKNSEHLIGNIAYEVDEFHAQLEYLLKVMQQRLEKMQKIGAKNIQEYNASSKEKLPFILFVIEELSSIMLIDDSKLKSELENKLSVLASKCRATGIHIVITTQKPNKKVITGLIKTNIPGRLALKVIADVDSQLIIGNSDATKLLGSGDALLNGKRLQVAFLDTGVQEEYIK
jgi:S-DNA-T family DNA segregation ATPase FtsK/SpoIIIE